MRTDRLKERMRNLRRGFKENWLLFKESKIGVFGLFIILFFVFMAIFAPVITSRDPVAFRAPQNDVIDVDFYWKRDLKDVFSSATGNASITYRLDGNSFGARADRIYVAISNALFATDASGGYDVWSSHIGTAGEISTPVVVINYGENNGISSEDYWIYLGTAGGMFYYLDDSGDKDVQGTDPIQHSMLLDSKITSIAVYNNESNKDRSLLDTVYVGTENGTLYAFAAVDHEVVGYTWKWRISLDGPVHMSSNPLRSKGGYPAYSPALTEAGDILMVGTSNGTLYAISTADQSIKWQWGGISTTGWTNPPIVSAKEAGAEVVYLGTDDGWVYALYCENGTELAGWGDLPNEKRGDPLKTGVPVIDLKQNPDGGILTTPRIIPGSGGRGGVIFVGSSTGYIYKINRDPVGSPDDIEYKPPGSTDREYRESETKNSGYSYSVNPFYYPLSQLLFTAETYDGGTAQTDDDTCSLIAFKTDFSISWRLDEDKQSKVKFSPIGGVVVATAMGLGGSNRLSDSIFFVTSDGILFSYSSSGKYMAPLPPTWVKPLESGNTYVLGTDIIGHDVLSQVVYGTRTALIIGFTAAFFSILIGVIIGLVAGYFGGKIEAVLMRFTDVMIVLPFLPFVIVLAAMLGPSIWNIIIVIALLGWGGVTRVIRAEVISLKERPFIESAKVTGASSVRIMFKHIAPNVMPLAFLYMTFAVSGAILTEAALSFIGLGDFTQPSWGIMLFYVQQSNTLSYPWLLWPPGLCIAFLSLGFYLVGRAFEQIVNPRLRRR